MITETTAPTIGAAPAGQAEVKHKVFVYGTLRQGECRNRVLQDSEFLGAAKTNPKFTMLHLGNYPAVIKGGKTAIIGELYSIDADTLRALDRIEGHPTFYKRDIIEVLNVPGNNKDGGSQKAWIYMLTPTWGGTADMRSVIETGDWKNQTPKQSFQ